jgi:hypothetical protein
VPNQYTPFAAHLFPWAAIHVIARCNKREVYFASPEDFQILLDHLGEMGRAYVREIGGR